MGATALINESESDRNAGTGLPEYSNTDAAR
jgi:hypothetical protein